MFSLKLVFVLYSVIVIVKAQIPTLPCGDDNLSCPRVGNITQCFNRSELCNLVEFCLDGSDEGLGSQSNLECRGIVPIFNCFPRPERLFDVNLLCNGVNDCPNGADELLSICENKCRLPYNGGCPRTRECISMPDRVFCGDCLGTLVTDFSNRTGECIPFAIRFINSTPLVNRNTITIEFVTNLPLASTTCSVESPRTPTIEVNCTSGSAVFDSLLVTTCPYTVRVVAVSILTAPDPFLLNIATDQTQGRNQVVGSTHLIITAIKFPYYLDICQITEPGSCQNTVDQKAAPGFEYNFVRSINRDQSCSDSFLCTITSTENNFEFNEKCTCPYVVPSNLPDGEYTLEVSLDPAVCSEPCISKFFQFPITFKKI